MSVVIVGGNERMERQYCDICARHGWKAKVMTKESGSVRLKMGNPDLLILFMNTVSHKMAISALQESKRRGTRVLRLHTGSVAALRGALQEYDQCEPKRGVS